MRKTNHYSRDRSHVIIRPAWKDNTTGQIKINLTKEDVEKSRIKAGDYLLIKKLSQEEIKEFTK